jgi:hypothetical protein
VTTKILILVVIVSTLLIRHSQSVSGTQVSPALVAVAAASPAGRVPVVSSVAATPTAPAIPCTARASKATLTTYFNAQDQAVRQDLEIAVEGTASTFTLNTSSSAIDGSVSGGRVLVSLEAGEVAPFAVSFPNCLAVHIEPLRSTMRL